MNIVDALANLEPSDDSHWTDNGLPRMDMLQKLTNTPDLTRKQVTDAAPDFTRASAQARDAEVETPETESVEAPAEAPEAPETTPEVMVEATDPDPGTFGDGSPGVEHAGHDAEAPEAPEAVEPEVVTAPAQTELEALQASLAVHTEAMNEADKIKSAANKSAKASSDQVNVLTSKIAAIVKLDPHAATAGIRDYIKQSNKTRMNRALAAQQFMGDSKAKFADVVKAVEVFSPLDKAMRGRKQARGSQRPGTRVPSGA